MFDSLAAAFARFVAARPWTTLVASLIVAIGIAAAGMPEMANDSEAFAPDDPRVAATARIDELFAEESSVAPLQVIISAEEGDVVTLDGRSAVEAAVAAIESAEVDGETLSDRLVDQPGTGSIISFLSPVDQAIGFGAPEPTTDAELKDALASALAQTPPDVAGLIEGLFSDDADLAEATASAGLVLAFVEVPTTEADLEILKALETEVQSALVGEQFGDVTASPFSLQLIEAASDGAGVEIPILLGIAVAIIALVLAVVYLPRRPFTISQRVRRSLADTGLTVVVALLAVSVSNGAAVLLGPDGLGIMGDLAGPSSIVPILLIGLAVDYVIHLNAAYRAGLGDGSAVSAASIRSVKVVGGALFLSAVTTIVGFLTNLFSGIPALFDFGLLASIGIAAALLLSVTLFPAARTLLDRRAERGERLKHTGLDTRESGLVDRVVAPAAALPRRAPKTTVAAFVGLLIAGGVAATNLEAGFSFLDFVPDDEPVRAAALQLTEDFSGGLGETTDVLVEGDLAGAEVWNGVLDATSAAADVDDVVVVAGDPVVTAPATVLASLVAEGGSGFSPDVAAAVQAAGLDADLRAPAGADLTDVLSAAVADDPAMRGVVHPAGGGFDAALVTFTTQAGTDTAIGLADGLDAAFAPVEAAGATAIATSRNVVDASVVQAISDIQVQSLLLALGAATVILAISFWRSDRAPMLGVLTALPVGLVVVLLFGFMALVGIPFGPVTSTLAAVVIGVGVDYTIHVTHRFRDFRREGLGTDEAIAETLATTGSALLTSGLTTAAGFAVLIASSLIPFQQFGVLTLVAIAGSALVSVLLLPSVLVLHDRATEAEPTGARNRGPAYAPGDA